MILAWQVQCDVCGKTTRSEEPPNSGTNTPPGWLSGTVNLFDTDNREGALYGLVCDDCSALPVRDLIVKQKVYREAQSARLS